MAPKTNPLKLNPLQLKTLTLLQEVARQPDLAEPDSTSGEVRLKALPHAHGNHFHLGDYVVSARDATGLDNPAVWTALTRKGLMRATDDGYSLTREGVGYDTGMREQILHGADH